MGPELLGPPVPCHAASISFRGKVPRFRRASEQIVYYYFFSEGFLYGKENML